MRHRAEVLLILVVAAFALVGSIAFSLDRRDQQPVTVFGVEPLPVVEPQPVPDDAAGWFAHVRQHCNPVEVDTRMRIDPPPATAAGAMHEAACYALAGRIDRAREIIEGLEPDLRYQAAGVVFEAGHPAADAGDDIAAGPLMELVVDFWPNHYMALYHGGAARYELGDHQVAKKYLERFLVEYGTDDGWRTSALGMLEQIAAQAGAR